MNSACTYLGTHLSICLLHKDDNIKKCLSLSFHSAYVHLKRKTFFEDKKRLERVVYKVCCHLTLLCGLVDMQRLPSS